MSWDRASVGALTHAELTDLVPRLVAREAERAALTAQHNALLAQLDEHIRDLERQLAQLPPLPYPHPPTSPLQRLTRGVRDKARHVG